MVGGFEAVVCDEEWAEALEATEEGEAERGVAMSDVSELIG